MLGKRKTVYFDNAATTAVDPKVTKAMLPYFEERYGNASSTHSKGREAREAMESARKTIAKSIGANPEEIIFTSGGTESNNFALKGIAFANRSKGNHIITTRIEHDCVINSCKWLEKQGFKVTYLEVDSEGFVSPETLEKAMTPQTILVSIIHGNNEIGTIQDMENLGKVCRKHDVYFHTDACQSYTKTELDVKKFSLDLVTLNAHKIHGPKGVGALYIRKGVNLPAWQHGGGHERNLRSGTENIPGIVGFAEAARIALDKKHVKGMARLRDKLIDGILASVSEAKLNGPKGDKRLCNNVNFLFSRIEGEAIGGYLDLKGISSSTGSACSAHTLEPSHVLQALGISKADANGSLRISISRFTTEEEVEYFLKELPPIIKKLRLISPL
jgi:cysteine desulfurase